MKYYKDIPTSEFYKIEDKCCNLFTTVQSYGDQYYDTYRCGVKTNDDAEKYIGLEKLKNDLLEIEVYAKQQLNDFIKAFII